MINLKYNLQWIIKQQGHFDIDEQIIFPKEMFDKQYNINDIKDVEVIGNGSLDVKAKKLYLDFTITGTMILPCALTLEEVEYPFDTHCVEVFSFEKPDPLEDVREVKNDVVYLTPVVFENIMLDVPMRVVKEQASIQEEGKGWKIFDKDSEALDEEYIDPRLAKLKDFFDDK